MDAGQRGHESPTSERNLIGMTKPGRALVARASFLGIFEDIPHEPGRDHRDYVGRFAAPGIRALVYAVVEGEVWSLNALARDYATFKKPDSDGRVDVRPFGRPCVVDWRPDAGETAATINLDLHGPTEPDGDRYLALDDDEDVPHIVIGWHEVPER